MCQRHLTPDRCNASKIRKNNWLAQIFLLLFLISNSLSAEIITTFPKVAGLDVGHVYAMAGDVNGNIYLATTDGAKLITSDGTLTNLGLDDTAGVAISSSGDVYFSSYTTNQIYKLNVNGSFVAFAGTGVAGYNGDGIPALEAQLKCPYGLAFDSEGSLYVADSCNFRIRKIGSNGVISTFLGNGLSSFNYGVIAEVTSIAFDHNGVFYFSETGRDRVRKINADGSLQSIVESRYWPGSEVGDNGPAILARVGTPLGLAFNANNELLIADNYYNRIRKVDSNGIITTIAGNGQYASTGDGGQSQNASLIRPAALLLKGENLYIGSASASVPAPMRRIGPLYKPVPPKILFVSSQDNVGVGFSTPGFDGGSQITGYTVTSYPAGGVDMSAGQFGWSRNICTGGPCVPGYVHVISGLNPGQTYTFTVHAINAVGAGRESSVSNPIVPAMPSLSIGDASVVEGNSGTTNLRFIVSLSKPSNIPITFNVSAGYSDVHSSFTAYPESDYIPINYLGNIPAGQTSLSVDVSVIGDVNPENDEYFAVAISDPANATILRSIATGTILDDELVPLLTVSDFASIEGDNGAKMVPFGVYLSRPAPAIGVTFDIESSAIASNGTAAAAGSDFYPARQLQMHIPAGMQQGIFYVKVAGDKLVEADEKYVVRVSNVVGAAVAKPVGIGKILNDDLNSLLSNRVGNTAIVANRHRLQCQSLANKITNIETRVVSGLLKESVGIQMILLYESAQKTLSCRAH